MLLNLLILVCTVSLVSCRARVAGEPQYDQVLQPGYPGWKQPAFKLAPKPAQGRFLYYRKTPEVDRLRSAVHELYMRPYNYVSYEVGGEKPSQYQYHHHSPTPYPPEYHQEYQYHTPENTEYQYHNPENQYHAPPIEYQNHVSPPQYPAPEYHQPEYPIQEYHQPEYPKQEYHHPEYPVPTYPQSYDPSYASTYPSYPTSHVEARVDHHAVAVIKSDKVEGVIHFYQLGGPTSPVRVSGNLTGLSPGLHGFHVHQFGDTTNGCKSMAGHFNPFQLRHGSPHDSYRHVGDLGNIEAGQDGVANIDLEDRQISLNGLNSIIGRGLVLHAGQDDLGRGGDNGSLKTGNAGGRVACAVIAKATDSV